MLDIKKTYVYKEVNKCKINLDFYGTNIEKSPAIIIVHGGGLVWGSREDIVSEQVQIYVDAGYSVISIDYRLAPETKLEYIVEDIRDAIIWTKKYGAELLGIDTNRIAMVGHSAGGYLCLFGGTLGIKPNAIVSFYGYGDIIGEWCYEPSEYYCSRTMVEKKTAERIVQDNISNDCYITEGSFSDRFNYYLYCRQNGLWLYNISGYNVDRDREKLIPYCPIHNMSKSYPPTLLIHGDNDSDVPFNESEKIAKKLEQFKVVNETIIAEGEDHAFDYDMSRAAVKNIFIKVLNFLNENI